MGLARRWRRSVDEACERDGKSHNICAVHRAVFSGRFDLCQIGEMMERHQKQRRLTAAKLESERRGEDGRR